MQKKQQNHELTLKDLSLKLNLLWHDCETEIRAKSDNIKEKIDHFRQEVSQIQCRAELNNVIIYFFTPNQFHIQSIIYYFVDPYC